jgi:hypothetical protein
MNRCIDVGVGVVIVASLFVAVFVVSDDVVFDVDGLMFASFFLLMHPCIDDTSLRFAVEVMRNIQPVSLGR